MPEERAVARMSPAETKRGAGPAGALLREPRVVLVAKEGEGDETATAPVGTGGKAIPLVTDPSAMRGKPSKTKSTFP